MRGNSNCTVTVQPVDFDFLFQRLELRAASDEFGLFLPPLRAALCFEQTTRGAHWFFSRFGKFRYRLRFYFLRRGRFGFRRQDNRGLRLE